MPKFLGTIVLAALFFGGGVYLLLIARGHHSKQSSHIVVEVDPVCNENDYLRFGISYVAPSQIEEIKTALINSDRNFMTISDGQSMHSILSEHQISASEIHALSLALQPFIRARDLAVGDLYQLKLGREQKQSVIETFVIKKLDSNRLPITYEAKRTNQISESPRFVVKLTEAPIKEMLELVQVDVSGTLFRSFMSLPFGNELMQRLMNTFAWRMRMPDEVFSKDHIEILVNKKYAENNFIGYGAIQSVSYKQAQRTLFATYFRSRDGKISGIFDENGKALEKEFSLSPVYEAVATSEQNWRMHPVRKIRIRHNGTDYRGTIGTDFFAIADGEVIEKRFDKMVGNMIRIRHKYGLHSEYFHADSLVGTLSVGSRVRRGQKIGAIGNTGVLCTGPHLHLGIYQMNGEKRKYVNILNFRKKIADMPSIAGQYLLEFNEHLQKSMAMMDSIKNATVRSNKNEKELVNR